MAEGGVTEEAFQAERARWIVLTPSADDAAWRAAIADAARAANLRFVDARTPGEDWGDPGNIFVTEDADVALGADPSAIVAIMPQPETAPDAVAEVHGVEPPSDIWHASLMLARAAALAEGYAIVTAADLARRPARIRLFGVLDISPPASTGEASRRVAVAAAFGLYRNGGAIGSEEASWSERLFLYDDKAARNWAAPGQLDITGRPRILVYGPYFALPPGAWKLRVRFATDHEAGRREYRLDWGTPTDFSSTPIRLHQGGVYEVEIEHIWGRSEPAELRLVLMEGVIDGRLDFLGAGVSRTAIPPQPRLNDSSQSSGLDRSNT